MVLYWLSVLPKLLTAPVRMPILRRSWQVTHTISIWWQKIFTCPKHDFTHLGWVYRWLVRTLWLCRTYTFTFWCEQVFYYGTVGFLTFGPCRWSARSACHPRGQNVAAIALDRRFLGTIIAIFKMWLCPFNQSCTRHPMTKLKWQSNEMCHKFS